MVKDILLWELFLPINTQRAILESAIMEAVRKSMCWNQLQLKE